jgi:hypothetical protein
MDHKPAGYLSGDASAKNSWGTYEETWKLQADGSIKAEKTVDGKKIPKPGKALNGGGAAYCELRRGRLQTAPARTVASKIEAQRELNDARFIRLLAQVDQAR